MISIIICSRNKETLRAVSQNVAVTIGVPYEIVAIDNREGKYSIFQAYNIGIKRSNYPLLCFMHEDIAFKTDSWGQRVVSIFQNNAKIGLVGVAGSSYKPIIPSGWSFPQAAKNTIHINILQADKSRKQVRHDFSNPTNETLAKVVAVDGVWFCTTKEVTAKILFDEQYFTSFHCYDVDFSLNVYQQYDVGVTYEVLIEHFSGGSFDEKWIEETLKLHHKWQHMLPINKAEITQKQYIWEEEGAFYYLIRKMQETGKLTPAVFKILWSREVRSLLSYKTLGKMHFVVVSMLFKIYFKNK